MPRLSEQVVHILAGEGLDVEEDRGGYLLRTGPGETPLSVWVNETDRVVRAEQVLAYPVDDFSPSLGRALDWLNLHRGGVCYSFQEAQRAVVGSTMWSSPNRDPSTNQIHLLVGLLMQAKVRDSSALSRVAEGEAGWEEVADTEGSVEPRRPSGRHEKSTLRFTTSRFDPEELMPAKKARRPESSSFDTGWREPPTRPLGQIADESLGGSLDAPTQDWGPDDRPDDRSAAAPKDSPADDMIVPRRTNRLALQLAVQEVDRGGEVAKQDLTLASRSPGRRLLRFLLITAVVLPVSLILFQRIVFPFLPKPQRDMLAPYLAKVGLDPGGGVPRPLPTATGETPLEVRRMIQPGADLLRAELEEPLEGGEDRVEVSLKVLGDEKRSVLETIICQSNSLDARRRAYELWVQHKFSEEEGARFKLLRLLHAIKSPRKQIQKFLLEELATTPPSDSEVEACLEWAPKQGAVWSYAINRLGRPGEGAEARAKVLTKQLEADTKELVVLRSLIRTEQAGPEALMTLVDRQGLDWCQGEEGRKLLVTLVKRHPDAADGLLTNENIELAAFAVDVIEEAGGSGAVNKLINIARDKGPQPYKTWIRQKAVRALREATPADATWPLVYILNTKGTPDALTDDVRRALRTYGPRGVEDLERYTGSDRSSTRRYAVNGLTAMASPTAVERLIRMFPDEPNTYVRRQIAESLGELQKEKGVQGTLQKGLSTFRRVARTDRDPVVRKEAERLYRSIAGR
ncbi:MAG TPA: hypothetical protein DEA08_16000 [Planctomycetes bacterium]|nr:hypothetical protein [Planctomycetota bacterium]